MVFVVAKNLIRWPYGPMALAIRILKGGKPVTHGLVDQAQLTCSGPVPWLHQAQLIGWHQLRFPPVWGTKKWKKQGKAFTLGRGEDGWNR